MQRQSYNGGARRHLLNPIHQAAHQEKAPAVFAKPIAIAAGVNQARVEIETGAFVLNLQNEGLLVQGGPDANALPRVFVIAAKNRIGQRLGQRNRHVESAGFRLESLLGAPPHDRPDYRLDQPEIARDANVDRKAEVAKTGLAWRWCCSVRVTTVR
jgi:hypothetical protein